MTLFEEWKDIPGYEGKYQVSNMGNVKALRWHGGESEKMLKLGCDRRGYPTCFLYENGVRKQFSVHRVVAMAFVPNPGNKPQVNHLNGIKADNRAENLEWCTNHENNLHASEHDLKHTACVLQFDVAGNLVKEWPSMAKAARAVGVARESIFGCCNGVAKTIKGYVWKYKKDVIL